LRENLDGYSDGKQTPKNSTSKQTVFCHVVFNENKSPVYFS
jgi:hypothetical protein